MLPTSTPSEHISRAQPVPSVARSRYSSATVSLFNVRVLRGEQDAAAGYWGASAVQPRALMHMRYRWASRLPSVLARTFTGAPLASPEIRGSCTQAELSPLKAATSAAALL